MNKVCSSFDEAVADICDGATVMVGGAQGPIGVPRNLILALCRKATKDLTIISNAGYRGRSGITQFNYPHAEDWIDHSILIDNRQVKKVICGLAFLPGRNTELQKLYESGEIELEHLGHGILVARIQAGGAGLGGIYLPIGIGTLVEEGREKRIIDGREYLFFSPLRVDFSLIWAYKADKMGNLIYHGTGRQYGSIMAKAAKVTIAEVEEIVEPGELNPECVVTPGVYVHRIVKVPEEDKK